MRTIVLALTCVLAGCASGHETTWGDHATAGLQQVLQSGPGGKASLETGAGRYAIPAGRLDDARTALLRELAQAPVETPWFVNPTPEQFETAGSAVIVVFEPERDDVVLYASPRVLRVAFAAGNMVVWKDGDKVSVGLRNRTTGPDPDLGWQMEVTVTPSVDRAWEALERAAAAAAVPPPVLHLDWEKPRSGDPERVSSDASPTGQPSPVTRR